MHTVSLAIVISAGVFIAIGLLSRKLIQLGVTPPFVATAAGVLTGGAAMQVIAIPRGDVLGLINLATQISLAIALTGTALMLPKGDVFRRKKSLFILLGIGMPGMWIASTGLIAGILGVSFLTALLAAATVTPTDPVLARTIWEGDLAEHTIPQRLRFFLLEESQLNDGLAYPFVLFAAALMFDRGLFHYWTIQVLLWSVVGGALLGVAIGYALGYLLDEAQRRRFVVRRYFLNMTVFLAVFSVMLGHVLRMDGVLTVAVAGLTYRFSRTDSEQQQAKEIQTEADLFFTLPVFFVLGLVLPWHEWIRLGWKVVVVAAAIVLIRRIPIVLLIWKALRPEIAGWPEAVFAGWFGPIGVSTLFYTVFAVQETRSSIIWPVVTLIIALSIVVHGLSSPVFTRWLGRWEKNAGNVRAHRSRSSSTNVHYEGASNAQSRT